MLPKAISKDKRNRYKELANMSTLHGEVEILNFGYWIYSKCTLTFGKKSNILLIWRIGFDLKKNCRVK
jgi:hypothetical protein